MAAVEAGPAAAPAAPAAASDDGAGARITLDPGAVVRNWRTLDAMTAAECGAVVKANAYGLGIEAIAPPLAKAGTKTFFVALEAEGLALRRLLPEATIYVLNGVFGDPREAIAARLVPFLSSVEAVAAWPDAPFALNVDTGMNRLGVTVAEAKTLANTFRASARLPALIASHFACADTPAHPLNAEQEAAFAAVRPAFAAVPASFANSAALLTRPAAHHDLARPGIALYGGASVEPGVIAGGSSALEAAVRLEARVIQVREALAGESVGYGAAERLTRPARLAIASLGYADGFLRAGGGADDKRGAPAFVNGSLVHLCGRASMDLITVDVTDARCERGDWIELFGPNVPLDEAAAACGTMGYELLTGLSRRAGRNITTLLRR